MEAYTEHDAAAEAVDGKRRDYGAADVAAMKEAIALSATALQNAAAGEEPMGGPFGAVIYKDGKKVAIVFEPDQQLIEYMKLFNPENIIA